jgi:alpha-glucosidase
MASNVHVIDSLFVINKLDRTRKLRVYLAPGYQDSKENYPVLYMHDGQNLFDNATSYTGEWKVDEALNLLSEKEAINIIVVGIDNGQEKRINEMAPWEHERFGKAEGKEYMDFIVKQVKPFIDNEYRTLTDKENTAIMGSSMGGLITHYAVLEYPNIFNKAAIFSPSYWYSDKVFQFTEGKSIANCAKIYLIVGRKEGKNMEKPAKAMHNLILEKGHPEQNIFFGSIKGQYHGEGFWGQEFSAAVRWLFN